MSLREWVNGHPIASSVIVIVVLVIALGGMALRLRSSTAGGAEVYYWDLDADEPFVDRADRYARLQERAAGRGVARAHLFTCGECEPGQWFGYLERLEERQREQMAQGEWPADAIPQFEARLLDGGRWVPVESADHRHLREHVRSRCGPDARPRRCDP